MDIDGIEIEEENNKEEGTWVDVLASGALIGLASYGAYTLTMKIYEVGKAAKKLYLTKKATESLAIKSSSKDDEPEEKEED